jgi:excisionase family DNA binding protein
MKRFMKVKDIAERLNVTGKTVYREIAHGKLQAVKIGRVTRIDEEALFEYLNRSKHRGA